MMVHTTYDYGTAVIKVGLQVQVVHASHAVSQHSLELEVYNNSIGNSALSEWHTSL